MLLLIPHNFACLKKLEICHLSFKDIADALLRWTYSSILQTFLIISKLITPRHLSRPHQEQSHRSPWHWLKSQGISDFLWHSQNVKLHISQEHMHISISCAYKCTRHRLLFGYAATCANFSLLNRTPRPCFLDLST